MSDLRRHESVVRTMAGQFGWTTWTGTSARSASVQLASESGLHILSLEMICRDILFCLFLTVSNWGWGKPIFSKVNYAKNILTPGFLHNATPEWPQRASYYCASYYCAQWCHQIFSEMYQENLSQTSCRQVKIFRSKLCSVKRWKNGQVLSPVVINDDNQWRNVK